MTADRPRPSARRGYLVGKAGTLLTAGGAGLGIRYLTKTGLSPLTALGLTLLAVGLALLVVATATLVRALRGWRRLWLLPTAAVGLAVLVSVGLGVAYAVTPPTSLGSATPADHGLTVEDVRFRTDDGVDLSGWYVASRNGAAVVLRHGSGSTRTGVLAEAAVLARHGYGVLLADARGHGDSGGRGMDLGWYGDSDVRAAVSFLTARDDVDDKRIGLLGLSMGGEEALGAAAADRRIRAVVAEGATARTAEDKAGWLPRGAAGVLQRGLDRVTYALVDLLTPGSPPRPLREAVVAATPTRFLLVTGSEMPDEARAAQHLRSAAPDRVEWWDVQGSAHTDGLATAPEEWERRVVGFFDAQLR